VSHSVGHPLDDLAVEMLARGLSLCDIAAFKDENKIVSLIVRPTTPTAQH